MKNIFKLRVLFLLIATYLISGCDILDSFKIIIGPMKVKSSFSVEVNDEIFSSDMDEYPHTGGWPYILIKYNDPAFTFEGRKDLFNSKGQGIDFYFFLKEYSNFETNKKYYFSNKIDADNKHTASYVGIRGYKNSRDPIYATSGWIEFTEVSDAGTAKGRFELSATDNDGELLSLKNGQFSHIYLNIKQF